jgi:hypothetical protein
MMQSGHHRRLYHAVLRVDNDEYENSPLAVSRVHRLLTQSDLRSYRSTGISNPYKQELPNSRSLRPYRGCLPQ